MGPGVTTDRMSRKPTGSHSRRTVLKRMTAAGLAGASLVASSTTTLADAPNARVVVRTGSYENPVTLDQVVEANREVVEDYFDRGGRGVLEDERTSLTERRAMGSSDRVGMGIPGTMRADVDHPDKYRTVGYVFTIGPDGVPTSAYKNVGNAKTVSDTHQRTTTLARKLREATTIEEFPGDQDRLEGGA